MGLTTKVLLRKVHQKQDKTYPLVIRVTYNRKPIYIPLGYTLPEKDFDAKNQIVKSSSKVIENTTRFNEEILVKTRNIYSTISKLEESNVIKTMSMTDIKSVIMNFGEKSSSSVFQFLNLIIDELNEVGKFGNARIYKDALNAWKNFRSNKDIEFNAVTYKTLKNFENFFLAKGRKPNTISVYLRTFRSAYNRAIKEGIVTKENYPFDKYTIPSNKTRKKAVTLDVIAEIENYSPAVRTRLWNSKNYFLFSFYTRGMNFVDIANLRLDNIRDGRIYYTRQKTGEEFVINVHEKAQRIINLYFEHQSKTGYIFPIIKNHSDQKQAFREFKNALNYFNKALKIISDHLKLDVKLSTYTARHSYATGLKMKGLSSEVIKEALGHSNVAITETYLKSFDNAVVDEADNLLFD